MSNAELDKQEQAWLELHERITRVLRQFGSADHFGNGDYLIVDENYGFRRHKIEVHNLRMIRPDIVGGLREALHEYPEWEIVLALDIPGTEESWPRMGLIIRRHEIIDGLRREFLPEPYRSLVYPAARPPHPGE